MLLNSFNACTAKAQGGIVPYLSVSGGLSHTGINTFLNIGTSIKKHSVYIGPKLVASQSFIPGRSLLGVNAGYAFYIIGERKWGLQVNLDYQNTIYRTPGSTNYVHEMAGAFCLNFYPRSPRFSVFANLGTAFYIDNYYDSYSAGRVSNSGIAPFIKTGIAYNLRK